ncbi:MBL fold metallo-hydrolase [Paenibacillus aurantius]|uniref:MBL fold metallo-hydrolase n=1 Tax=Paenibacillus aurantius TaxID=2918900 RepID=A0AA96RD69_9BACL|nr:MBL fold metallo-hydrolase [Paenibacillus aurantius]WNQ09101.1 MBL fold metallo-hydrolase [Paenibacillus aurantius]
MGKPVKLFDRFYVISGDKLSHPWDASAYFIAGEDPTLIDCGSTKGYPALKENLEELGYRPGDIRRVLATHSHWDHLSAMALLKEESDAKLYIHEAAADAVEQGDPVRTAAFLYDETFPAVKADVKLEHGDRLEVGGYEIHVHHTPGHTPGCVSFWLEVGGMKLLIAGDTLWGGYHPRIGSSLEDWERSLDHLLTLDFDVMTTGHIPPTLVFDAKTKVEEARQQLGVYFNPWFKSFHLKFRY